MPEARWLWRRLYVFALTFGVWLLLGRAVMRVPAENLPRLTEGLMMLQALTLVLYLVAPTTQQIVALLANLKLRLGGVV
jgi:hypothetical protein